VSPVASQSAQDAGSVAGRATTSDPRPSIAVLPFENRSADQDDALLLAARRSLL
jgi:TolB-like protein